MPPLYFGEYIFFGLWTLYCLLVPAALYQIELESLISPLVRSTGVYSTMTHNLQLAVVISCLEVYFPYHMKMFSAK